MMFNVFPSCYIRPIGSESKNGINAGQLIENFTQGGIKKVGATFKATTPDRKASNSYPWYVNRTNLEDFTVF